MPHCFSGLFPAFTLTDLQTCAIGKKQGRKKRRGEGAQLNPFVWQCFYKSTPNRNASQPITKAYRKSVDCTLLPNLSGGHRLSRMLVFASNVVYIYSQQVRCGSTTREACEKEKKGKERRVIDFKGTQWGCQDVHTSSSPVLKRRTCRGNQTQVFKGMLVKFCNTIKGNMLEKFISLSMSCAYINICNMCVYQCT